MIVVKLLQTARLKLHWRCKQVWLKATYGFAKCLLCMGRCGRV